MTLGAQECSSIIQKIHKSSTASQGLLVLHFPIVIDRRIVVSNSAFVFGIVESVGHIDKQGFALTYDLVAVTNTRRNQDLPGTKTANIHGVALPEGRRAQPEIHQGHLEHSFH